jgi:hypothetical protein
MDESVQLHDPAALLPRDSLNATTGIPSAMRRMHICDSLFKVHAKRRMDVICILLYVRNFK